ncbi:unnamed protein product [Lactuca virosa]|uniref:Heat shock protein 70 n=1 Tax=Lactuca virosa TaxID=75947 RepID=A0AAU9MYL6_9ASTR|nr:unnamed protein product [Lactuca virosa]
MVYQGERSKSTDNYFLGSFRISGIPPAPKGVPVIQVTFEIDNNGILTVTARIASTGKTEKLIVTNVCGRLSKQEIEKMIEDAEKFKLEDQEFKRKAEAYNELEDCIYHLKRKIKSTPNMPPKVQKNIRYTIDDTMEWLSDSKVATIDKIKRKKEHMEFITGLAFPD